jgi:excisionase family DNA binding protein
MKQYYSTQELSQLCNVGETTIKRWANLGLVKHYKTLGGHRKFKLDDALEFLEKSNLNLSGSEIERLVQERTLAKHADLSTEILLVTKDSRKLSNLLFEMLMQERSGDVQMLVLKAYEDGFTLDEIADDIITPVMHRVGMLWAKAKLDVGKEHIISQIIQEAVTRLKMRQAANAERQQLDQDRRRKERAAIAQRRQQQVIASNTLKEGLTQDIFLSQMVTPQSNVVICAGPEQELHSLPLMLISLLLNDLGFEARNIGPLTPFKSLEKLVRDSKPMAVCLSVTIAGTSPAYMKKYEAFRKFLQQQNVRLVTGGQFIGEKKGKMFASDFRATTLKEFKNYFIQNFAIPNRIYVQS